MESIDADLAIAGSGLAGLFAALTAADDGRRAVVVTKARLGASNSFQAQGGIAAAIGDDDSPLIHEEDTLRVGGGLSEPGVVAVVAAEAPARIRDLIALGVPFDQEDGVLDLALEAGHSRRRVLHAGGAATGARVIETLSRLAASNPNIHVIEHARLSDLRVVDGECVGFDALCESGERLRLRARATVLASGGPCGLYRRTTNPTGATGDGLALAYSAGAVLADLEFVQFHPTAVVGHGIDGLLISEAVRGEGAWLIDENGERFMTAYHPAAELAPRDVVSRAVRQERVAGHETYLTAAHLKPEFVRRRFPSLVRLLDSAGLDLCSDRIPVAPAAHFMMGGVRTDLVAASSVPRLYAVGEVACHGTHGANRLASNGLLECLVFGHRAASASASLPAPEGPRGVDYQDRPAPARALERRGRPGQILGRAELGELLDLHAGVVRDADGLQRLVAALPPAGLGTMSETVARLLAESALFREESRGGHFRADFPQARADFAGHTFIQRAAGLGLGDWSEEIAWPRAGTGSR